MAGIEDMAGDLAKAMAEHAKQSVAAVQQVAKDMADAASSMSSPAYGITIMSRVEPVKEGTSRVVVATAETSNGIGTVFGGLPNATASVARKMDGIAQGAGLDRRG